MQRWGGRGGERRQIDGEKGREAVGLARKGGRL